ncbi:hypothetical protein RBB50_006565 [Rhinocladiella similis]
MDLSPRMRVINEVNAILWNMDKTYLPYIKEAGYVIPDTEFVHDLNNLQSSSELEEAIVQLEVAKSGPVTLKPSICGSSEPAYLLREPGHLNAGDKAYL